MKALSTRSSYKSGTLFVQVMCLSVLLFSITVSVWWVIKTGAVTTDSLIYLKIGSLFFSENHSQISPQFPPLFPLVLEFVMALGFQPTLAAKLLNLLLLGSSATLLYKMLTLNPEISRVHSFLIAFLIMTTYVIVRTHTKMLSESLFIFLIFCNFYWLMRYAKKNTTTFLGLAAFFASLAALSRYAGVAVIVSTVVTAWLLTPKLSFARMQKIVLICAAASILFALWLARNYWLKSSLTGRQTSYLGRESLGLLHYADIFTQLFFPSAVPLTARLLCFGLLLLILLLTIIVVAKNSRDTAYYPILLISVISASMQLTLVQVTWFIDSSLPIVPRILTPAYSLIVLMQFVALSYWVSRYDQIKMFVAIYIFVYILLNNSRITILSQLPRYNYNNPRWVNSETIQYWNNEKHKSTYIVSNAHNILGYHLHRKVDRLPFVFSFRTKKPLTDFSQEMKKMLCRLDRSKGYLVYLNAKSRRTHLPSLSLLLEAYPLRVSHQFSDGAALEIDETHLLSCPKQ